jgi:His/Glu/Gln/Arg/opine family amino acid ABC transporter permease subunit
VESNALYNLFIGIGESIYQTLIYDNRYKFILEGLFNTIIIALFAVIIGTIIGTLVALIRNNYDRNNKMKILNSIVKWYVDIIRGTPVVLQLMIIYYVIFKSVDVPVVLVGIIPFGINSGAYVSEIIRAGIQSIPKGQSEAGYALGLNYNQVMKHIILPQALKNVLPALGNEFITLVKETSIGAYIGIIELTKASDIIASRTYDYFFPLIIVAIIYLIITLGLSKGVQKLERKLNCVKD